jgi:hypothetical protein
VRENSRHDRVHLRSGHSIIVQGRGIRSYDTFYAATYRLRFPFAGTERTHARIKSDEPNRAAVRDDDKPMSLRNRDDDRVVLRTPAIVNGTHL